MMSLWQYSWLVNSHCLKVNITSTWCLKITNCSSIEQTLKRVTHENVITLFDLTYMSR